ncbi:hypothetical protein EVAR_71596_1 [Eumeta japonica]|uniref:Uncharacterized protein n=1 Tax=Eumeta variegata TaxID=151549 RepID=A0A4C1TCR8_EUMVA|nr:hypothetical protein EVAR_71596_1 [Eumeta japonica]
MLYGMHLIQSRLVVQSLVSLTKFLKFSPALLRNWVMTGKKYPEHQDSNLRPGGLVGQKFHPLGHRDAQNCEHEQHNNLHITFNNKQNKTKKKSSYGHA